jgi:hypothetical protein
MSEKKLTEEELKDVTGGAKFSVSSEKTANRGSMEEGVPRGVIVDPWGGPENDPIYSDVSEKPKG